MDKLYEFGSSGVPPQGRLQNAFKLVSAKADLARLQKPGLPGRSRVGSQLVLEAILPQPPTTDSTWLSSWSPSSS